VYHFLKFYCISSFSHLGQVSTCFQGFLKPYLKYCFEFLENKKFLECEEILENYKFLENHKFLEH